ncbi:hypothetical protein [Mucilaginibacter paludis]|uniref:Uncharacterized protein n=1 Tax=Mucilaginibacter paludis DSM 18603 TaxID=714943 RepID=H1YCZ3_9SPHI|nr:hypothetical protein [Mucilaginibacter paludis]EHQ25164.1 hypothetical protein Mucpa_0990 [Mucilaginibacter paludis DSM 18603]
MKPLNLPYLIKALAFFVIVFVFQSCGPGDPGVWKNNQINSGRHQDFRKLNDELFAALKANKSADVENMMSKELLDNGDNKRLIELLSNQCQLGSYHMLDECYIINYKPTDTHVVKTTALDGNKYTLRCRALTEEMYIAFMIPKTTGDKWVISAVYCNYDYGWKLNKLDLQQYTCNGKTAPQLFKQAKDEYEKGYLIDATNSMDQAGKCNNPSIVWEYPQDAEMRKFYRQLVNEANTKYKLPLAVSQVSTKPQIFRITNQTNDAGVFPAIYYLSRIKLSDTTGLRKENESIKKVIGQVFPGIDKNNKYIFFSAFNQKPQGSQIVPFVDMTAKF